MEIFDLLMFKRKNQEKYEILTENLDNIQYELKEEKKKRHDLTLKVLQLEREKFLLSKELEKCPVCHDHFKSTKLIENVFCENESETVDVMENDDKVYLVIETPIEDTKLKKHRTSAKMLLEEVQ